jgi:uncharacterized membrane protein
MSGDICTTSIGRDRLAVESDDHHALSEHQQPAPESAQNGRRNVGRNERLVTLGAGTALLLAGRWKGNWTGLGLSLVGGGLLYRGASGYCPMYEVLGISTAPRNPATVIPAQYGVKVQESITVNATPEQLYGFWHNLTNLPQVFKHLNAVEMREANQSHWIAAGPANVPLEWDAVTTKDVPNEVIAWNSLPGSRVDTAGSVHFTPTRNNRGTVVTVSMKYDPPGGRLADYLASWFDSDLNAVIHDDLRRFKSVMEAGEIPRTDNQPRGPSSL